MLALSDEYEDDDDQFDAESDNMRTGEIYQ